jgi:hypothetical protein
LAWSSGSVPSGPGLLSSVRTSFIEISLPQGLTLTSYTRRLTPSTYAVSVPRKCEEPAEEG